jgi:hypothetical protein
VLLLAAWLPALRLAALDSTRAADDGGNGTGRLSACSPLTLPC